MPDSLVDHALALAADAHRAGPDRPELLSAEIMLFARARRYPEVSRSYDRLVATDSAPSLELSRLAIAAAHHAADTVTLLRVLTKTAANPAAGPSITMEANILRQVARLWMAINDGKGMVRQNPKYVARAYSKAL